MNAETRAKEIADRARELYHQIDNCVVSGEAVSLIFNALRKAQNDKLEAAALLTEEHARTQRKFEKQAAANSEKFERARYEHCGRQLSIHAGRIRSLKSKD